MLPRQRRRPNPKLHAPSVASDRCAPEIALPPFVLKHPPCTLGPNLHILTTELVTVRTQLGEKMSRCVNGVKILYIKINLTVTSYNYIPISS